MRRRIFINIILALLLCLVLIAPALAADKARAVGRDSGIGEVVALGDASSGNLVEVDNDGSLQTREFAKTVVSAIADSALVSTAAKVYNVIFNGTTAGDRVDIYDAASATGTPKFEIDTPVAGTTTQISIPGGATFSTGIYADVTVSGGTALVTVVYDS